MNWICYFEKYNSDRKLLSSIESEIARIQHSCSHTEMLPELQESASLLRAGILKVDHLLDDYVSSAKDPKDAAKRAQEQLYLCLRYQQNLTIEATAEAMEVSRDTAYRIRRRIVERGDIFTTTAP